MKNKSEYYILSFLFFFILIVGCENTTKSEKSVDGDKASYNCTEIPQEFDSFEEMTNSIRTYNYTFTDEMKNPVSSLIKDAEYYSCDGEKGYLILQLSDNTYIYESFPIDEWREFKKSPSLGRFYNRNIKGNYKADI